MKVASVIAALLLTSSLAAAQSAARIPILFDTDIGDDIDDAIALALALQSPELDIRGVTTVFGVVDLRTRLAWKELGLYGRQDIPLATGAGEPMLDAPVFQKARQFETLTDSDFAPEAAHRRAAEFLIATLMNSQEKITVVPVGPLTNIALALRLEPKIKSRIERIVLMGGAFRRMYSEWNIQRDRVAAQIVFSSGVPITAVGLDVTLQCKLEQRDLDKLRASRNPATDFLVRLIGLWQDGNPGQTPILHDPLAMATVFRPDLIKTETGTVEVETASPLTFGMTIFKGKADGTTRIATQVSVRGFVDLLIDRISAPPRGR
ncbi:MAG TPA: nucleoside hydrolase [Bryobacteraceae bacterium]